MYVAVSDSQDWIPTPHKKDHNPGPLPESLREAVRLFLLICSARAVRGDDRAHNSMLAHATRFVLVQNRVAEQVEHELNSVRTLLDHGSPETRSVLEEDLSRLWHHRIGEPHPVFEERFGDRCLPRPQWEDVLRSLPAAAAKVRVMKINGTSDDALAYSRTPDGLSVIVIGGDKLSRGLTLEGLSVSYFLRTSNMFDTLMQMGRWFGYRPRYADLCRVYTTPDLYGSFREIALAVDDLRADLDRMALSNRTPQDFGLRVRTPSDGLLISAANKLRRGESIQVRFAGEIVQSLQIPRRGPAARANREALERLVAGLPQPERSVRGDSTAHFVWHDVAPSVVLDFLTSFEAYRTHSFLNRCEQLRRYIQDRIEQGELIQWTVCIVSKHAEATASIGGQKIPLIERAAEDKELPADHFGTKQMAGRAEEASDLTHEEFRDAMEQTWELERRGGKAENELSKMPAREEIRSVRPPQRGVLLLYPIRNVDSESEYLVSAAVSFPNSETAAPLTYTVNDVWRSEYGLSGDWDDLGQPT
jgi:hypothetical protein